MAPEWMDDVGRFTDVLEATQQELLGTLRLKRRALVSGSISDMQQLNQAALDCAQRLKGLTVWRSRLLERAHSAGLQGATLSDILAYSVAPSAEQLRARFAAVQQRFGEARREAWIQWIIAQRAGGCYADILELIANGGQKPPVYGDSPANTVTVGGAVLDAAV